MCPMTVICPCIWVELLAENAYGLSCIQSGPPLLRHWHRLVWPSLQKMLLLSLSVCKYFLESFFKVHSDFYYT